MSLEKELNLDRDFSPPSAEEWKTTVEKSLKGASFEDLVTPTNEGIDLQPIYTIGDIETLPYLDQKPGFAYYLRGTNPGGYLSQPWEICQEIPTSLARPFNEALQYDLQRGQTGIHLSLDPATQKGLDSDSAAVEEVGKNGTAISTLEDFSIALADIDIEKYPLHITAGFSGLEIIMVLNAFLKQQGKEITRVKGSIDTDPLGYMVTHGDLPILLETAYDRMSLVTKWACRQAPFLKTIGVSGLPYHNAGADAVRELAYVLAMAVEYIDRLLERGMAIDDIAGQMRFTFGIGPFYFMEIAKLRAARILWAKIIETCGGGSQAQKITIHARTSSYNQTKYDPYVNMLRTATEAFSAVTAGVDSLHTNPFSEVFGSSDEFSRRVARNTQVLLHEECRLDRSIDPAGGSYYVEKLTHEVCQKAWDKFREIEAMGGMFKALQKGFPQDEIAAVHEKRKQDIVNKKSIIVGTNYSANINEKKPQDNFPDYEEIYRERKKYLTKYRNSRSSEQETEINKKLSHLKNLAASNDEEVIPAGTESLIAGATISEINEKFLRGGLNQSVSGSVGQLGDEQAQLGIPLITMPRPHPETNENQHKRFAQHIGSPRRGAPGRAAEDYEELRDREYSHE
jgi:methylmalonyl-CoA mutase